MGLFCLMRLLSCQDETNVATSDDNMRDSLPVLRTYGVSTLISDSGIIRYKIIAEDWYVYDRTDPPRWTFMKGLFLEKFDNHQLRHRILLSSTTHMGTTRTCGCEKPQRRDLQDVVALLGHERTRHTFACIYESRRHRARPRRLQFPLKRTDDRLSHPLFGRSIPYGRRASTAPPHNTRHTHHVECQ